MQIVFYSNFSKKKNSTKQPNIQGTTIDVVFKHPTSIENPTFVLNAIDFSYNYCYMAELNNFYYIEDIKIINNALFEVSCKMDVLASYKYEIGQTTAFINRASNSYNIWIDDSIVQSTGELVQVAHAYTSIDEDFSAPSYVVSSGVATQGLIYYAMTTSEFNKAMGFIRSKDNILDVIENAWVNFNFDPISQIQSVKYFPFIVSNTGTPVPVALGMFITDGVGRPIVNPVKTYVTQINKPARYYNDVRDFSSRFTSATIYLPGYGAFPLDAKFLQSNLYAIYTIDVRTGDCTIEIAEKNTGSTGDIYNNIAVLNGSLSADIKLTVDQANIRGAVDSTMQIMGDIATMNVAGAIDEGLDLNSVLFQPTVQSVGTFGSLSFLDAITNIQLEVKRLGSTSYATSTCGRPLQAYAQISSLGGYIQCANAVVDCGARESEKSEINSYLNAGFYYE